MIVMCLDHQRISHTQHQFARVNRLGQEVGGSQFQRFLLDPRVAHRGQYHDRYAMQCRISTHLLQNLNPADLRHHDVEQDDVRSLVSRHLHGTG